MKKKTVLRLCYTLLVFAVAVLVLCLGALGLVWVDEIYGFDEEWVEGKTLGEVLERYGPPDLVANEGFYIGYNRTVGFGRSFKDDDYRIITSLFQESYVYYFAEDSADPDSVIGRRAENLSSYVVTDEWRRYPKEDLIANWAKGKPLEDVISLLGTPDLCVPQAAVIYSNSAGRRFRFVQLFVEKNAEGTYFVSDAELPLLGDPDPGWTKWEPASFGISSSRMGWLIGCIAAGVLGIAAMTVPVFLRRRKVKASPSEAE